MWLPRISTLGTLLAILLAGCGGDDAPASATPTRADQDLLSSAAPERVRVLLAQADELTTWSDHAAAIAKLSEARDAARHIAGGAERTTALANVDRLLAAARERLAVWTIRRHLGDGDQMVKMNAHSAARAEYTTARPIAESLREPLRTELLAEIDARLGRLAAVTKPTPDDDEFRAENPSDFHADNPFEAQGFNTSMGEGGNVGGGGAFADRKAGSKEKLARAAGGGKDTESAVTAGLEWLKRHQDTSGATVGMWDSDGWQQHCDAAAAADPRFHTKHPDCKRGQGWAEVDNGVTGLALLAFLGAGHTSKQGDYTLTVRNGLQYLIQNQQSNGCFANQREVNDHHYPYSHAICVTAMAEAYGMTGSRVFEEPAQRGIEFLVKLQIPGLGWRYATPDFKPKDKDNDTSVTAWMLCAAASAKMSELVVPDAVISGGRAWIASMTDPKYGKIGYAKRGSGGSQLMGSRAAHSEAMTAAGMAARLITGDKADLAELKAGATLLLKDLPVWDAYGGKINFYYWYYGSLAMFQVGGKSWDWWNVAMKDALLPNQRRIVDGDLDGSWDPFDDAWGVAGGRVYATAINVLTLEVYYRYARPAG